MEMLAYRFGNVDHSLNLTISAYSINSTLFNSVCSARAQVYLKLHNIEKFVSYLDPNRL